MWVQIEILSRFKLRNSLEQVVGEMLQFGAKFKNR
jgi:hypothetical protein